MYEQNQPSLWSLFGIVFVFIIAATYGFITLSTEDALWFVPTFSEEASEVSVLCKGVDSTFETGSPHLAALNSHINEALSGSKNWDSLTMSDDTYEYYHTSDEVVVLEYRYSKPVRVHSIYTYFSNFNTLVVPLVGRHAKLNAVFARVDETSTAGALHIRSTESLMSYLTDNALCTP